MAMLIEIAQKQSKYQPELSFGTHFFQDLVEENIKYLPLYPEDSDSVFNQAFFRCSGNALPEIMPAYSYLGNVVKVINVQEEYPNKQLVVLMNGDLQNAVAYLEEQTAMSTEANFDSDMAITENSVNDENAWKWRHYMETDCRQAIWKLSR